MSVHVRLFSSGIPARMGAAAFTPASTVESATGGYNHRVTAVYGTEPVPAPGPNFVGPGQVPPGPVPPGGSPAGRANDAGQLYPTWSAVAPALPLLTVRPVGGGYQKPPLGGFVASTPSALPQDLVVVPHEIVRQGARQGRVTTAPRAIMRWVRQGG
jgi:hypothetical protein